LPATQALGDRPVTIDISMDGITCNDLAVRYEELTVRYVTPRQAQVFGSEAKDSGSVETCIFDAIKTCRKT